MSEYLMKGETLSAVSDKVRYYIGGIAPEGLSSDPMALKNTVTVYYREFVDVEDESYEGLNEGGDDDTFIAFAYLQNNEGVTVPVLYDTNTEDYPDEPDTAGPFFYEGTAEIDGVVYDKWRKIELNSTGFTWDSTSKQYVYTNVIVGISPTELPSKIDDVYNKGFSDGEANGTGGTAKPVLYGTHILKESLPNISSTVTQTLTDVNGMFFDGETVKQDNIRKITLSPTCVYIYSSTDKAHIENSTKTSGKWKYYYNYTDSCDVPDNRYRIIEFSKPNEVSQDFYDLFMSIVDNNADITAYGVGRQAQYDEFWDMFQDYGNRTDYGYAFRCWQSEYIRPKYKVVPTSTNSLANIFYKNLSLKKIEKDYFDFSNVPFGTYNGCYYSFAQCKFLEEIEDIGLPPLFSYTHSFSECKKLHTIAKITLNENVKFDNTFYMCYALINLTIDGTIGQNGLNLSWSTLLSKESIISVINALSATTTGLSITLSLVAKNNAFPPQANGIENFELSKLLGTKNNWTVNFV